MGRRLIKTITFDEGIWGEMEKVKIEIGIPISRVIENAAKEYLGRRRK